MKTMKTMKTMKQTHLGQMNMTMMLTMKGQCIIVSPASVSEACLIPREK